MDIFALGLILNELFTGHVPHGADYRKIESVNSQYAHLDSLVDSMIRQRAEDRPQSVAQVRRLLIAPETRQEVQESSTVFFSRRFGKAFPGVRGIELFRNPRQARERLEILLAEPLMLGKTAPIWWWRSGDLQIETVQFLNEDTILIDGQELILDWIAAVNARSYYQQFVYIQTKPEAPSGLYDYSYVDSAIRSSGFASEEFALYQGRPVTRAEYDDGAAVIDGKPVTFDARPELRTRFLTPYNLLIAPHDSPINNAEFDETRDAIMNRMLRGNAQISELVDAVLKLPKRPTK